MSRKHGDIDANRRMALLGGAACMIGPSWALTACNEDPGNSKALPALSDSRATGSGKPSASDLQRKRGGYDGIIKIGLGVHSNRLVNGSGQIVQLRGGNMSGLEVTAPQGWNPADPWADDQGPPNWAAFATWKPNAVRIPLCSLSWLGYTGGLTGSQPITFTETPSGHSLGGSLTSAWQLASGVYPIVFDNATACGARGTFTNGSTAVSWLPIMNPSPPGPAAVAVVWAKSRSADPGNNYRQAVFTAIVAAQAIGCYVILDFHWGGPLITIGGESHYLMPTNGQAQFIDATAGLDFWESIASIFGSQARPQPGISNHAILFELFNEPFMNSGGGRMTTLESGGKDLSADQILLSGGWSDRLVNNSEDGNRNYQLAIPWQVAGYQQVINAIRAKGANNICIINGNYYAQDLSGYSTYKPTDPLSPSQIVLGWHCYAQFTTDSWEGMPDSAYPYEKRPYHYPSCGRIQSSSGKANADSLVPANDILAAGYPILCTEDGGVGGTHATSGEKHLTYMHTWCDANDVGHIPWQWNLTQPYGKAAAGNALTGYASDGKTILPLAGAGQVVFDWMVNHD